MRHFTEKFIRRVKLHFGPIKSEFLPKDLFFNFILPKRSLNALANWLIPVGDSLQIILMI